MSSKIYDYAIIGTGAAGLHLVLAMINDPFFENKKILLLDKNKKDTNDKTWCFWEKNEGKWDSIIRKTWSYGDFFFDKNHIPFSLSPYKYKMLQSLDFYNYAKAAIQDQENIDFIFQEVNELVENKDDVHIQTSNKSDHYTARHVFDSTIEKSIYSDSKKHITILQHFKGWYIETAEECFNEDRFTMMDYRLQWRDSCSFTYLLPLNKKEALIEFTLFTPELIEQREYDSMLENYIKNILSIHEYKIQHLEYGVIPMTTYPFQKHSTSRITKIGTAGAWVKPSSGYSFKNAEKYAAQTIQNIKSGIKLGKGIQNNWAKFTDAIFLNVLFNQNSLGPSIFNDMYSKNPIQKIFSFLDEENSILGDLKIISSFKVFPFLKGLAQHFRKLLWI